MSKNKERDLPALSPASRSALETYVDRSAGYANADITGQAERAVGTLGRFAPAGVPDRALDAAALQELSSRLDSPNKRVRYRAAGSALASYFDDSTASSSRRTRKSNAYVATLLGDMPYIDAYSNNYKQRLDSNLASLLLDDSSQAEITKELWRTLEFGPNIPALTEATQKTNIESLLARAALAIDQVTRPPDDDRELFRRVLRAEAFAPLLEVLGLHAFDMFGRSETGKARVVKAGREDIVEDSSRVLEQAKTIEVDDIFKAVLGRTPKQHLFKAPSAEDSHYPEKIIFSSTALNEVFDDIENGDNFKINSRFKSVGRHALKRLNNSNYDPEDPSRQPLDVFGMLAVMPDELSLGSAFGSIISRITSDERIKPVTAPGKGKPFFIQGTPGYVKQVYGQVPPDLKRFVETKIIDRSVDSVYQVSKLTCQVNFGDYRLPLEFQLQTDADRTNARLGSTAHMNHVSGGGPRGTIPGKPGDLQVIYYRINRIDAAGERVNGQSIPHRFELAAKIRKSLRTT